MNVRRMSRLLSKTICIELGKQTSIGSDNLASLSELFGFMGELVAIADPLVDLKDDISEYNLELIGRGHHAGENGEVYDDLETMSTALNITREVSVKVMR